jgi:hypothetical protein
VEALLCSCAQWLQTPEGAFLYEKCAALEWLKKNAAKRLTAHAKSLEFALRSEATT